MSYFQYFKYLHPERIQKLNNKSTNPNGKFVAYWIEASQRVTYNHALEFAIIKANEQKLPLIAFFGMTAEYPNINQRHAAFMLQGLQQLKKDLAQRDVQFIIMQKSPDEVALEIGKLARSLIVDTGYLNNQRKWRKNVAQKIDCELIQVETDVMVPVQHASQKQETSASQLRPKILGKISYYNTHVEQEKLNLSSLQLELGYQELDISNIQNVITQLKINQDVSILDEFYGGEVEAKKILKFFLEKRLSYYSEDSQDPSRDGTSQLSPYLHFGMISPIYIYNETVKHSKQNESQTKFIEQVLVRRELAANFCYLNENYDNYKGLPAWAVSTLAQHKKDKRHYLYTREQLERAQTHDGYWNAAQKEAIYRGKVKGHMRMYWGKKILQWSQTPEEALDTLNYLNDKYHLDGRDMNGYASTAWIFGNQDRQFDQREIYGTIRYMVDNQLPKKFDMGIYLKYTDRGFDEWRQSFGNNLIKTQQEQTQMQQQQTQKFSE